MKNTMKTLVGKIAFISISGDVIAVENQQKITNQINLRIYAVTDTTENIGNAGTLLFGKLCDEV